MGTYVYIGRDGPDGARLRPSVRERHLAHIERLDGEGRILFAGPLRDADGAPCGSLVVFEADDLATARASAERDPYFSEGVFARIEVHESLQVFPKNGA
jgi:uncharacterized protein YciI